MQSNATGTYSPWFWIPYVMLDQSGSPLPLMESECENKLGVYVYQKMTFNMHVYKAIATANRLFWTIHWAYHFLDQETLIFLCNGQVRPALGYGVVIWSQYPKKAQDTMSQSHQNGSNSSEPTVWGAPERLQLLTLTYIRYRGDMIQVYKYPNGLCKVQSHMLYTGHYKATIGHAMKFFQNKIQPYMIIRGSYTALFLAKTSLKRYILLPLAGLLHPSLVQLPGEYTPACTLQGDSSIIAFSVYCQLLIFADWTEAPLSIPIAHVGRFLMSQLPYIWFEPTILWLRVQRTNHSAIATRQLQHGLCQSFTQMYGILFQAVLSRPYLWTHSRTG